MTTEIDEPKKNAKAAPAAPVRNPDEIPVTKLMFRGGVDLPNEQQVSRITTIPRADRPRYEIHYMPRVDKYRVREFSPSEKPGDAPALTFLVPGDWCLAVLEGAS